MLTEENKLLKVDIEIEDKGVNTIISPYDPSDIKIDHQNVNLGYLLEKIEYDEIDLNPDFQREGNLWDKIKQSQLIESILLGLPLPSFYFSVDEKNDKWQIVDGLQRLSTLHSFWIEKDLELQGLEFLEDYTKKDDLSRADLRKISGFKINLYVIEKETPKKAKFIIFKRVNTGGLILKPQEMRHALNQGIPADFIKELAQLESFKKATNYKIRTSRQEDRDFVNRFVAFYLLGYQNNYLGDLDSFLNDGMGQLDYLTTKERINLKETFNESMKACFEIFEQDCFRKRYDEAHQRNPISKSLYDSISVNIGWLNNDKRNKLIEQKNVFKTKLKKMMSNDKFHRAITAGTAQKNNVSQRFNDIKNLIEITMLS